MTRQKWIKASNYLSETVDIVHCEFVILLETLKCSFYNIFVHLDGLSFVIFLWRLKNVERWLVDYDTSRNKCQMLALQFHRRLLQGMISKWMIWRYVGKLPPSLSFNINVIFLSFSPRWNISTLIFCSGLFTTSQVLIIFFLFFLHVKILSEVCLKEIYHGLLTELVVVLHFYRWNLGSWNPSLLKWIQTMTSYSALITNLLSTNLFYRRQVNHSLNFFVYFKSLLPLL